MKLWWLLAWRFLFGPARGYRSGAVATAFFGIFIASVCALVGEGVLDGYQNAYRDAILRFNTHVVVSRTVSFEGDEVREIEKIFADANQKFPLSYSSYLYDETLLSSPNGLKPVVLKGVDFSQLKTVYPFEFVELNSPKLPNSGYAGRDLVAGLPQKSASLPLVSVTNDQGQAKTHLEHMALRGSFFSGLYFYDSQFILLDLSALQKRLGVSGVSGFELRLQDPDQILPLADFLREHLPDGADVQTWDQLNSSLLDALRLERLSFSVIAFLVLSVAGLNVFGFNFLLFVKNKREFAVLSALGLSHQGMTGVLLAASALLSGAATAFAALVAGGILWALTLGRGLPLDPSVYYIDRVPAAFQISYLVIFVFAALGLSLLAGLVASLVVWQRHGGARALLE